ncbi:EAL domain-containing protein [Burkholderia stagnalis]|uniref:EAL domain-containing protein n=1 Tax=Burkholderia stagnalis TaxID=1503054 RepID=UPI000F583EC6|nr:EAL domain-containing protein [Burkholderia stagnalis]RQQ01946.1 EAL domain-containing protein [Burkholderia stagnalis]RQQ05085.1 EAL domain-containing protein [Burkholderia stagnalis]RQQ23818.1 EAL domain-containing protein [Burkholderia stagnalis]RQQ24892.1 EAL domain-containing protein [Burkholderia stagnalis]RQQ27344.1 EAL domain-containing protein [Burkholderia stagnalis]
MNADEGRRDATTKTDEADPLFDTGGAHVDLVAACRYIENRLEFAREPVCRTDLSGGELYRECLARFADGPRNLLRPASFLPRISAMGLMRWFDQLVVRRTIDSLRADAHAVYGCNVSATSATEDAGWRAIFDELDDAPSVAKRLVIEITETAPLNPVTGRAFVSRIRQSGCRIAIDDFGVGYSAANHLVVGNPDIVKMDRLMLVLVRHNAVGRYQLRRLVAQAYEHARDIVAEGVENELDRRVMMDAGIPWAQGFHFSGRAHVA